MRNSTILVGPFGRSAPHLRRLPDDTSIYDLQWLDSGRDLVSLSGQGVGPSGTLSFIDPRDGRRQTLATAVTSFAVTP